MTVEKKKETKLPLTPSTSEIPPNFRGKSRRNSSNATDWRLGLIVCNFCLLVRKEGGMKIHPGTAESFSNGSVYLGVLRHEVCLRQLPSEQTVPP